MGVPRGTRVTAFVEASSAVRQTQKSLEADSGLFTENCDDEKRWQLLRAAGGGPKSSPADVPRRRWPKDGRRQQQGGFLETFKTVLPFSFLSLSCFLKTGTVFVSFGRSAFPPATEWQQLGIKNTSGYIPCAPSGSSRALGWGCRSPVPKLCKSSLKGIESHLPTRAQGRWGYREGAAALPTHTHRQRRSPHAEAAVEFLEIAAEETLEVFPSQNTAQIFRFSL